MIRPKIGAVSGLTLLLLAFPGRADAVDPTLNERIDDIRAIHEIALSPDGVTVASTVTASTAEGGQGHIWLLAPDGRAPRQLTFSTSDSEPGESSPAWAPDGQSLFFRAKRDKVFKLYRLPLGGREARAFTIARSAAGAIQAGWNLKANDAVEVDPQRYMVSPDGRWIAMVGVDGDTAASEAQVKKKDDAVEVGRDDQHKARLYLIDVATGSTREIKLPDNVGSLAWDAASRE